MQILPITNINNKNHNSIYFKSKYPKIDSLLRPERIEEQLNKLSNFNDESKKLLTGLTAVAGSLLAEFAILTETNQEVKNVVNSVLKELEIENVDEIKEKFLNFIKPAKPEENTISKEEQIDYSPLFEEKPERNTYLAITSKYFPNLNEKYENMLIKSIKEPENDSNMFNLDTLESIFAVLTNDEGLKYRKRYFEALDKDYIDCLNGICTNYISTIKNGATPMQYLVLLSNGAISPEEINKWAKADSLSLEQFMKISILDEKAISAIAKIEEQNKNFKIKYFKPLESERNAKNYAFKLEFNNDVSLREKLTIIKQVHEAIYGPIYLKADAKLDKDFMQQDIQTEMVDNILKDRYIDAVYNFVRYINPPALEELNVKPDEVRFLDKNDERYQKLKQICTDEIMHMDFDSNRIKSLCNILNNKDVFGDIITTRHGKLRFLTRIVLKEPVSRKKLAQKTEEKMEILKNELSSKLELCNIFCYLHSMGMAPQFYLKDSELGNYLKVTLNSEGSIHTLYEDIKKEIRDRELAATEKKG